MTFPTAITATLAPCLETESATESNCAINCGTGVIWVLSPALVRLEGTQHVALLPTKIVTNVGWSHRLDLARPPA